MDHDDTTWQLMKRARIRDVSSKGVLTCKDKETITRWIVDFPDDYKDKHAIAHRKTIGIKKLDPSCKDRECGLLWLDRTS